MLEVTCVGEIFFGQEIKPCLSSWTENSVCTYKTCMTKSQNTKELVALTEYCIKFNQVLFSTAFLPGYRMGPSTLCLQDEVLA